MGIGDAQIGNYAQETTDTTLTGTYDLQGVPNATFQTIKEAQKEITGDAVGPWTDVIYHVTDGTDHEIGLGTLTSGSPDTLTRGTILESTNSDAAVSWGAGNKTVIHGPAGHLFDNYRSRIAALEALPSGALTEVFRGLTLQTHPDKDVAGTKLMFSADEIVLSDGQVVADWDALEIDSASDLQGGGGLSANTWYKVYARYNGSIKDGWLVEAKQYFKDEEFTTVAQDEDLRAAANKEKLAQSFQAGNAGNVEFVDLHLSRVGSPSGRIWVTIEADSSGSPSGTPLATSDKLTIDELAVSPSGWYRIPFRSPFSISATTTYWIVLQGSYTVSGANYIRWYGSTTDSYANGEARSYNGSTWQNPTITASIEDFAFRLYVTINDTAVSPGSGYVAAHIGWARTNGSSAFIEFYAKDRIHRWNMAQTAVVSASSIQAPTLVDIDDETPPAPVVFLFGLTGDSGTTLTYTSAIAGVPEGLRKPASQGQYNSVFTVNLGNANNSGIHTYIPTMLQGVYHHSSNAANGVNMFPEGFIW